MLAIPLSLSGCMGFSGAAGTPLSTPVATPNVPSGPPQAPQQLSFAGDLQGTMTNLVAHDQQPQSECSGPSSRGGGVWASTLYGHLNQQVYGVVFLIKPYRGPGTYDFPTAQVEVSDSTSQRVWQSAEGGQSEITVDAEQLSGTVRATLTSASSNHPSLQLSGKWSCYPA
ncbi:MAG: hypothetical protein ACREP9_04735 [Candidatus Dormibacteraceae bacterium]